MFDEYVVTSWSDKDGLVASLISAMAQDQDGYLWLGTQNGLIRYDGLSFARFDSLNETPLPDSFVDSLCVARDGSLWVGHRVRGISRIRNGHVQTYGEREGFTGRRVTALIEDLHGTIWAGTRQGLYRFANDRWQRIGPRHGLPEGPAYTLYQDHAGTLWVGTSGGVFRREDGQEMFETVDESLRYFPSFGECPSGTVWVTDPVVGFRKLLPHGRPNGQPSRIVRSGHGVAMLHDRRGNLWLATFGQGLWFVRHGPTAGSAVEVIGTHNGLPSNTVRSFLEDREGNVWVGTYGTEAGLHKFSPRRVTPVTDLGLVRAVEAGADGHIWVGTDAGLARFSGTERRWYRARDGLPSSSIRALHADTAGALWVATELGVARFARGRLSRLPLVTGTWPTRIVAVAVDSSNTLWICDQDSGLLRWRHGRLTAFDPSPQISHAVIDSVTADRDGRVWLSVAGGGIGLIDRGGAFRLLRPSDSSSLTDMAVYQDRTGAVWFGGGDRLTRFTAGQLAAVTRRSGFPGEAIKAIADDDEGYLWIATNTGLVRLAPREFDKAVADLSHQLEFRLYDSSDGLAGMPIRFGYPNAVRGIDGRLWFVTGRGLTVVDPRRISAGRPAPPVRIEHLSADGRRVDLARRLVLPSRTARLQFDYNALTFVSPTKVEFRYRLEGFDEAWIHAGTRRQAIYTNLPPRRYRFRVIARSNEGMWNEQGTALDFSIQPTPYHTRWFYAGCAFVIMLAVWAGWKVRLRRVRRQFALVLAERVRLSREIHDTLLQSLVGVALQLDAACGSRDSSSPMDREPLVRIRKQVEQYIREARQAIWNLRSPTLETRDLATVLREAGERAVQGKPLAFELLVSGSRRRCPAKVEEQVLRIGQEAITNAVRHARAHRIGGELHYDADSLRLTISDDGCGFDPGDRAEQPGNHCGLLIMQERAEQAGGLFRLATRPGDGTTIEVVIPISRAEPDHGHAEPSYSSSVR